MSTFTSVTPEICAILFLTSIGRDWAAGQDVAAVTPMRAVSGRGRRGAHDPIADPEGSRRWAESAPPGMVSLRLYPTLYHEVLMEIGREKIIASMIDWLESVPGR